MSQTTLDGFVGVEQTPIVSKVVLMMIMEDLNVAWMDKDWYLHSQDLLYLEHELASLLAQREIAMKVEVPS